MCFYCKEDRVQNLKDFVFEKISDLKEHWQTEHLDGKPFRFYVIDLLKCNVDNCGYFSSFQGLYRHHKRQHPKEIFSVIKNERCALCHHKANDSVKHVCGDLEDCLRNKMFSPVRFTDENVTELLNVNQGQKIRCRHCNNRFEDRARMMHHHREQHRYVDMNLCIVIVNQWSKFVININRFGFWKLAIRHWATIWLQKTVGNTRHTPNGWSAAVVIRNFGQICMWSISKRQRKIVAPATPCGPAGLSELKWNF